MKVALNDTKNDFLKKVFVAFLILLFLLTLKSLSLDKIKNDYPAGYQGQDAYYHLAYAQFAKDTNQFSKAPQYTTLGIQDTIIPNPPLFYYLAAFFSNAWGLPVHDAIALLYPISVFMVMLAAAILMRKFGVKAVVLSMPLFIFMLINPFKQIFSQGWFLTITATSLLVPAILMFYVKDRKIDYFFLGIFISGIFLTHVDELSVLFLIIFAYFLVHAFMHKEVRFEKRYLWSLLPLVLCLDYAIIFVNVWLENVKGLVGATLAHREFYEAFFSSIFYFKYLILLGAAYAVWKTYKKEGSFGLLYPAAALVIMLLSDSLLQRFERLRYFIPIHLAMFYGLGIMFILDVVSKFRNKVANKYAFFALLVIPLFILAAKIQFDDKDYKTNFYPDEVWKLIEKIRTSDVKNVLAIDMPFPELLWFGHKNAYTVEKVYRINEGEYYNYVFITQPVCDNRVFAREGVFYFRDLSYMCSPNEDNLCRFDHIISYRPEWLNKIISDELMEKLLKGGFSITERTEHYTLMEKVENGICKKPD